MCVQMTGTNKKSGLLFSPTCLTLIFQDQVFLIEQIHVIFHIKSIS